MYWHFAPFLQWLQMIHMKYGTPDSELQNHAIQVMEILQGNDSPDPHALVSSFVDLQFLDPWTGYWYPIIYCELIVHVTQSENSFHQ